jgi:hypothetical protein
MMENHSGLLPHTLPPKLDNSKSSCMMAAPSAMSSMSNMSMYHPGFAMPHPEYSQAEMQQGLSGMAPYGQHSQHSQHRPQGVDSSRSLEALQQER